MFHMFRISKILQNQLSSFENTPSLYSTIFRMNEFKILSYLRHPKFRSAFRRDLNLVSDVYDHILNAILGTEYNTKRSWKFNCIIRFKYDTGERRDFRCFSSKFHNCDWYDLKHIIHQFIRSDIRHELIDKRLINIMLNRFGGNYFFLTIGKNNYVEYIEVTSDVSEYDRDVLTEYYFDKTPDGLIVSMNLSKHLKNNDYNIVVPTRTHNQIYEIKLKSYSPFDPVGDMIESHRLNDYVFHPMYFYMGPDQRTTLINCHPTGSIVNYKPMCYRWYAPQFS